MIASLPSLKTRALGAASFFSASKALSALYSWMNPVIATRTTIAVITMVSAKASMKLIACPTENS